MAQPESTSPSLRQVLGRLGLLIGITYALVLTSFWLPPVPLDSGVALAAFWVAHSGGAHGLPYVALALMLALALRPDRELTIRRRVIEGALITVIGVAALGRRSDRDHVTS